ncbi:penicillin-binding protein 2 [Halomonas aquamarina]|jgi:penicillin-binding protein 2|uniref:Peptidoglycan D,D-transpeptidase MrdA n=1 Tax=Vreelandella aquamarina TaxID=77097 RepID=A0A0D7V1M4_9GAMM|nr:MULTISPECIES: penicillin-binding protein 2 [Halomonas]MEC9295819.1 penicillin-binding protein 2 [Pseudomonadota bacterium]HAV45031.1 penicillin-binding protein 2 [Halomonas sp.]KJD20745.1 penicillin-binding protein 2 [Halomonas meridiana]MCC4291640.1 penicillin-binding protein 2 [Halomonas axialensis]MCF2912544.1 penicillin-binding protein 2 [Halomonas sp. Cn5-12]|tara:strand:+ start:2741 stop:4648 length:1908 start_codon:yes stop_codon:yes gene_type:complete
MPQRRDTLKNPEQELRIFRVRALLAVLVVIVLTSLLVSRLGYLQIVQHDLYSTRSEKNRVRVEPLPPNRGLIYDRNGTLLAENRPTYNLTLVRERVDDLDDTLALIVDLLELPEEEIEAFQVRSRQRQRPFQPALLMSDLSEEQIARLAVNRHRLPGVEVEAQLLRYYPDAEVMAHALGYVGRINAEELQDLDPGRYAGTHFIGKTGVERFYETELHGEAGLRKVETNARGRVLRELGRTDPVPGANLTLTLDRSLQMLAYELLDGRRGSIVAIVPNTGEILAMVSTPGFDSNQFVTGIDVASYRALQEDIDLPLFNRAIRGHYPPGSTIKPFLALAGLVEGVITPDSTINDPGFYQLPNDSRRYRNWLRWGHGRVDMERSIAVSNNTYYYTLAHDLGIDKLHERMTNFGFGQRVAHDVQGESTGLMPSRDWKRARFNQPWYPGETLSVGIGQGYWQVTPLQLASATAALANRGHWVKPRLALRIGEEPVPAELPDTLPDIQLANDNWWDRVYSGMEKVLSGSEGTARRTGVGLEYRMGGKSGTAQVFSLGQDQRYNAEELEERLRDHALFMAFAPIEEPKIAVSVIVENAGGGSTHAAHLARAMTDAWLLEDEAPEAEEVKEVLEEDTANVEGN